MDFDSFRNKLDIQRQKIKELTEETKSFLIEYFNTLIITYPELTSFSWHQGEYYNDEGYSFSADIDSECLQINEQSAYELLENTGKFSWQLQACRDISKVLRLFTQSELEQFFGRSDCQIVITKDNIKKLKQ